MGRLITLCLVIFLVANPAFADKDDHNEAYKLLQAGKILPLESILKITREQIQGRILEVELEHEDNEIIYELEVLDKKGIVWEIKINAANGNIIEIEVD